MHRFDPLRNPFQIEILGERECADEIDQGVNECDVDEEIDPFEDGPYQQDQRDRLGSDDIDGDDSVDDPRTPERPEETQGDREQDRDAECQEEIEH